MRKLILPFLIISLLTAGLALYVYANAEEKRVLSLQEAISLARDGKIDEAIKAVERILRQNPDAENAELHLKLGLLYFKAKRYESALEAFAKTAEIRENSPMAYYFTGLICEKIALGKTDRTAAVAVKRKALEAWQNYLKHADETKALPEKHRNICITVEESIERARKHVELLEEDLRND